MSRKATYRISLFLGLTALAPHFLNTTVRYEPQFQACLLTCAIGL